MAVLYSEIHFKSFLCKVHITTIVVTIFLSPFIWAKNFETVKCLCVTYCYIYTNLTYDRSRINFQIEINEETYLKNMISVVNSSSTYWLKKLRETNEKGWRTQPITVNAYNYFGDNSISKREENE